MGLAAAAAVLSLQHRSFSLTGMPTVAVCGVEIIHSDGDGFNDVVDICSQDVVTPINFLDED